MNTNNNKELQFKVMLSVLLGKSYFASIPRAIALWAAGRKIEEAEVIAITEGFVGTTHPVYETIDQEVIASLGQTVLQMASEDLGGGHFQLNLSDELVQGVAIPMLVMALNRHAEAVMESTVIPPPAGWSPGREGVEKNLETVAGKAGVTAKEILEMIEKTRDVVEKKLEHDGEGFDIKQAVDEMTGGDKTKPKPVPFDLTRRGQGGPKMPEPGLN